MNGLFYIQAVICLVAYSILILAFFTGWLRTPRYKPDQLPPVTRVSILIPCRNEAENIPELAALLSSQDYPKELLEIIWIDDSSTDGTEAILNRLPETFGQIHVQLPPDRKGGKKAALKAGMDAATGELILLTDADSRPGSRWVQTMAKFYEDEQNDLILGPVILGPADNPFRQIQKLEYLSQVAASVGAAGIGLPIMAQGPNIAVRAADYLTIVNDLNDRYPSGDDVFLVQQMKRDTRKKIGYILNPDAVVCSRPADSWSGFFRQRRRWASKAKGYRDPAMICTTLLVFAANLEIFAALLGLLCGKISFTFVVILLIIKTLADLPILCSALRFFRCMKLLLWMIPVQLFYPVYITAAGLLSQIAPIRWKERSVPMKQW